MNRDIQKLVRKNILNLSPYSSAREEYKGHEGVFLDANENPFGSYNRYPDPYQSLLKRKLAEIKKCNADEIFIGNGSDEVIDILFRIFCEPYKDKALTFTPTYGMYEVAADINAVDLIKLSLTESFQIDRNPLESHINDENLKVILICSPNNPTGNLLNLEDIKYILENFKGITFIDEAYIDFCDQPSFLHQLKKYPNLIVSQTLSKAWGMAGIRLGIAYMNKELLTFYNKVKSPYNISSLNQEIALKTLNNIDKFEHNLGDILEQKDWLIRKLKKIDTIKEIYPSDANFVLVRVKDANKLYNLLVDNHVIVRNRNSVLKNCIRITVGTKQENKKLIKLIKEFDHE